MSILVLALSSILLTAAAIPAVSVVIRSFRLERVNFKGAPIPSGFGVLLVLAAVPLYAVMLFVPEWSVSAGIFAAAVLGFGAVGLLDDVRGSRDAGGFRGHLGLLRHGRISTGLVKAAVGGFLALALGAVIAGFDPVQSLVNGLVISLAANFLNLLDLRPGRAVSCFWFGLLAIVLVRLGRLEIWHLLIPILAPAAWLTRLDRSARVMLGDAGSNVLGAVLGLTLVYVCGLPAKLMILAVLVGVHVYAEKYSISKLIDGNPVLRRVDRLLGER